MEKILLSIYGLFLLLGAFFGWKRGSKISLVMGSISSVLVFCGIFLIGLNPVAGYVMLTVIGALLCFAFFMRLKKTRKFMPAGMLLSVSIVFLISCLCLLMKSGL